MPGWPWQGQECQKKMKDLPSPGKSSSHPTELPSSEGTSDSGSYLHIYELILLRILI